MRNNTTLDGDDSISPSRRRLLQVAGAAASFGGLQQAAIDIGRAFEGATSLGQVHFVEAMFIYEDAPRHPRMTGDAFPTYLVDPDQNRLLLTELGRPKNVRRVRRQFVDNTAIVYGMDFHALPAALFDGDPTRYLTVDRSYNRGAIEQLPLAEPISDPSVHIEPETDTAVSVSVEDQSTTLDPHAETKLRLNPREITYRVPVPLDEIEATAQPTAAQRERPETTTVTPVLKVRNNGILTMYNHGEEYQ